MNEYVKLESEQPDLKVRDSSQELNYQLVKINQTTPVID